MKTFSIVINKIEYNIEENGGGGNSWYRIYSKLGVFNQLKMEPNINKNPQEYIIKDRQNVPSVILKIEKELSAVIQKSR